MLPNLPNLTNPHDSCKEPEEACGKCVNFQKCKEIVRAKYKFLTEKEFKALEIQARKNSLGSIDWEGYTPPDK